MRRRNQRLMLNRSKRKVKPLIIMKKAVQSLLYSESDFETAFLFDIIKGIE